MEDNQQSFNLDPNKWTDTLPGNKKHILNNKHSNSNTTKYYLMTIFFIIGLMTVSIIKNKTRNLQKEISSLRASVDIIKHDLHQSTLEHAVITSPENISILAKEYLDSSFLAYKNIQIKKLNDEKKISSGLKNTKKKILQKKSNLELAKKIESKKNELMSLKEFYYNPDTLPGEVKLQISKKIESAKNEMKALYNDPKKIIETEKLYKWGTIQIVKVMLGIPVVPGR